MYKLIIICVIFLIYKENPREMKIKKFNDFIGESFLDNSVFSRIGSIVSGKKEYSPSAQSAETEESPKNVGSQSSISSSTDTTKSSIGQKTSVSQGSFNLNTNKNAPLVVVFGGTDVGGKASGKYMYDYFTPDVLSKYNVFVANSSRKY